jgi:hypothetical protein
MNTDQELEAGTFPKINPSFGESLCRSVLIRVSSVCIRGSIESSRIRMTAIGFSALARKSSQQLTLKVV